VPAPQPCGGWRETVSVSTAVVEALPARSRANCRARPRHDLCGHCRSASNRARQSPAQRKTRVRAIAYPCSARVGLLQLVPPVQRRENAPHYVQVVLAFTFGFEGKHGIGTDTDAGGIVLMGARLYNPATGRFLQVDPIFGGSCNAYDYVCQDPVNGLDLSGTNARKCSAYDLLCLNVKGTGTHVTAISATIEFTVAGPSAMLLVGSTLSIEILVPEQLGSHKIYVPQDFVSQTITESMVRDYTAAKGIDGDVPSEGLNLPDGAKISAFLTNADGQVMASASATVEAHPFLWGLFSS
jgi:RHS repeat-associated protein